MQDLIPLQQLALLATKGRWSTSGDRQVIAADSDQLNNGYIIADCQGPDEKHNTQYIAAANPGVVLALIEENETLGRYLCTCRDCGGEGSLHTGKWHYCGHMDPPEPVMEKCGECDGTGLLGEIQDLYQVITERDQLKAEVEALRKTGDHNREAAAKVLSAGMDYPWEHMPEKGRESMRKLAKDVIDAALLSA